jgi:ribosome-associated protein
MADPIPVSPGIVVPAQAIRMKAVRSGGPGGQNVNKVASKVELRVNLQLIEGLDEGARQRLQQALRNQLDAEGCWIVVSSATRDQRANLDDAREKVLRAVEKALRAPTPRTKTNPTRSSQTRRLEAKRHAARIRHDRKGGDWD